MHLDRFGIIGPRCILLRPKEAKIVSSTIASADLGSPLASLRVPCYAFEPRCTTTRLRVPGILCYRTKAKIGASVIGSIVVDMINDLVPFQPVSDHACHNHPMELCENLVAIPPPELSDIVVLRIITPAKDKQVRVFDVDHDIILAHGPHVTRVVQLDQVQLGTLS